MSAEGDAQDGPSTQAHTWQMLVNNASSTHVNHFSAFKDIIDNPREAFASHCRVDWVEQLDDDLSISISDNGCGFRDRQHLQNSYDLVNTYNKPFYFATRL